MYELITALRLAWADQAVQSVILTGAGEKAFCTGGDVKQRAETGDYGPSPSASPKTAEKYVPLIRAGSASWASPSPNRTRARTPATRG